MFTDYKLIEIYIYICLTEHYNLLTMECGMETNHLLFTGTTKIVTTHKGLQSEIVCPVF